jgi:hypothetical protein
MGGAFLLRRSDDPRLRRLHEAGTGGRRDGARDRKTRIETASVFGTKPGAGCLSGDVAMLIATHRTHSHHGPLCGLVAWAA